jgi:hypothetical protein
LPTAHTLGAVSAGWPLCRTSDPALRQRSHAGLNKGEASNALRRAVLFHRQGEIRDRTFENHSFRASGLSLITAAIVHWNTVYLDRAVHQLRAQGATVPDDLLAHVAPLGWEHIGLTGDYVWSVPIPLPRFGPYERFGLRSRPWRLRAVLNKSAGDPYYGPLVDSPLAARPRCRKAGIQTT